MIKAQTATPATTAPERRNLIETAPADQDKPTPVNSRNLVLPLIIAANAGALAILAWVITCAMGVLP